MSWSGVTSMPRWWRIAPLTNDGYGKLVSRFPHRLLTLALICLLHPFYHPKHLMLALMIPTDLLSQTGPHVSTLPTWTTTIQQFSHFDMLHRSTYLLLMSLLVFYQTIHPSTTRLHTYPTPSLLSDWLNLSAQQHPHRWRILGKMCASRAMHRFLWIW